VAVDRPGIAASAADAKKIGRKSNDGLSPMIGRGRGFVRQAMAFRRPASRVRRKHRSPGWAVVNPSDVVKEGRTDKQQRCGTMPAGRRARLGMTPWFAATRVRPAARLSLLVLDDEGGGQLGMFAAR